jgi:hypothetical protein
VNILNGPNGGGGVGGTSSGAFNVIANNGGSGVRTTAGNIQIRGNSIYLNTGAGIDLGTAPNIDHCDTDGLQNYPVITSAVANAGNITITGTFDSVEGVSFDLEFFSNIPSDAASNRGGRVFLGSTPAVPGTPPTSCSTPWSVVLPFSGAAGDTITATATKSIYPNGTSWFSAEAVIVSPPSFESGPVGE